MIFMKTNIRSKLSSKGGRTTEPKASYGGRLSNIGNYYVEGLSSKSNKRITTAFYKNKADAILRAKNDMDKGKIVQAEIYNAKTSTSDVVVADIDTKGKIRLWENNKLVDKKEEVEHSTLPKETIENSGVNVNKAPSLINVEKEDTLITVDLKAKQIRVVKGEKIDFINLSNDDVEGYTYLFKEDKPLFFSSLSEDVKSYTGQAYNEKDMKIKNVYWRDTNEN